MSQPKPAYPKTLKLEDFSDSSQLIVKDYICPLCEGVYFNPVIDTCSHMSCEKCFLCFDASLFTCPFTQEPLPSKPTKVNVMITIIEKQTMHCTHQKAGCRWEGQMKDYPAHIENECLKELVKCSLAGCSMEVLREDFNAHLEDCAYRPVECEYCNASSAFVQLESHHLTCLRFMLDCPQKCSMKVPREAIEDHIANDCDYTLVNCGYHSIGCEASVMKKDTETHKKDSFNEHLDLIFKAIFKQNQEATEKFKVIENRLSSLAIPKRVPLKERDDKQLAINNAELTLIGMKRGRDKESFNVDNNSSEITKKYREDECNEKQAKATHQALPLQSPLRVPKKGADSIFDLTYQPTGVTFEGNKAKNKSLKTEHKFIFIKAPFDLKKALSHWRIKVLSPASWIGLGVCDREKVLKNDLKFFSKSSKFVHGAFLISTNGYLWNSNTNAENSISIQFPPVNPGDCLDFLYDPLKKDLLFQHGTFKGKLTNVDGADLVCCVLFLNNGNEVEVLFDS